jgi:uncharacterized membrane protein YgcG
LIRRSSILLVLLACAAAGSVASADERILSYDSTITVLGDGSLDVRETIRVRAEGRNIKRGIFRDFPTVYRASGGRPVIVAFDFRAASRDGQPENWRTEPRDNGVRVYLGRADVRVPRGEHTYEIEYHTDRQLGFFADHDELYWNVTGNGWDFAIDTARATVVLPGGVPASEVRLEGYTGPQGAKGQDYSAQMAGGTPVFATTRRLNPREGLTIVAMWPKGYVRPSVESNRPVAAYPPQSGAAALSGRPDHRAYSDSRPVGFAVIGFAFLVLYYYWAWTTRGRDPPGRVIIPEYEPPEVRSPGGMRFLLRMGYDDKCFAADVLSLAVKGHLTIAETDGGLLSLKKVFTLTKRTEGAGKPLTPVEEGLLAQLFRDGDTLVLKPENHSRVSAARSTHRSSLKGRIDSRFFRINGGWHALGILISLLVGVFAIFVPANTIVLPEFFVGTPLGWLTILIVLLGLVANGVFGWLLKAPTVSGRELMDHVLGFKMYLEVAEGEELKRMTSPLPPLTPQLYESYLPAALALGVEQQWAERFSSVFALEPRNSQPTWYAGSNWNSHDIGAFSARLGTAFSSAISSSAQAPGSSSGGGGGGSSGGGGGGGGGGGW